jgi:hypothetical protein
MEILRKITIKTCGNFTIARIKEVMEAAKLADGQSVPLLKIVGESTGAKTGQTTHGMFTRLSGSFVGTDMTTGALYQSGQCILPEFIGAQLGAALSQGESVRFAFQIEARRKDNAITGYEFAVKPLIESKPANAMQELMALAGIKLPDTPKLGNDAPPPAGDDKGDDKPADKPADKLADKGGKGGK